MHNLFIFKLVKSQTQLLEISKTADWNAVTNNLNKNNFKNKNKGTRIAKDEMPSLDEISGKF